jgi:hypothetical protein
MLEKMKKNPLMEVTIRHELGGGDVARAQARANPSPDDCRNLAGFLRDRKIQLMRLRSTEAGRAKALLVSSDPDAQTAVAQLRAIDREIAQNEDALDRVYDLLRPGAERQAARRTRAAAIEIGRQRIDQIRQTFLNSGLPDIEQRVRIANPQFNPDETDAGGRLIVQLVAKQKKK